MTASVSEREAPAPTASTPTEAEILQSARTIGASLVDRQAETEQRTFYAPDTHEAMSAAGFYRMLTPKRYGGLEVSLETYFKVLREIGRGCPSSGWMLGQSINHTVTPIATFFPEHVQAELFAGTDFIAPAVAKPSGTATRAADGGWIVNGTFDYCSGAPYSTHLMAHSWVTDSDSPDGKPEPLLFVAPASEYTRLNNWGNVLGLKGSGSHSCTMENGYVPENWAFRGKTMVSFTQKEILGGEIHGNPMYAGSTFSFYLIVGSTAAVATTRGALDEYEHLADMLPTPYPPFSPRRESDDYKRWINEAYGLVTTAEAALDSYIAQWMDLSERHAWSRAEDLRLCRMANHIVDNLCWNAMQLILKTAGTSQITAGRRIERVWRDFTQILGHGFSRMRVDLLPDVY